MEEREFMRIERKLKKIGPQGGRGWGTAIARHCEADEHLWNKQWANNWTAINKNILVVEREFMRMER